MNDWIRWFNDIGLGDIDEVGGKNASLGELIANLREANVRVPDGFATTASAYRHFIKDNALDARMRELVDGLNTSDVAALAHASSTIRSLVENAPIPGDLEEQIRAAFDTITASNPNVSWAVRSSATAEDLPDASFAGQQETYLNVRTIEEILDTTRRVFASLFNDRAVAYRAHHGYSAHDVAISVGVQRMVRSDAGAAGVMFTIDTESGFDRAVLVTSSYGLGESVVQGAVNPDEFYVYKPNLASGRDAVIMRTLGSKTSKMVYSSTPGEFTQTVSTSHAERRAFSLNDFEIEELARYGVAIESHYGRPMDIEWAKDGVDGQIYILQARPETVKSKTSAGTDLEYRLIEHGEVLVEGRAVGQRIGSGRARVLRSLDEMGSFQEGDVLIADMTTPDWEPIMAKASAIVTDRGGRTCHAAIIAREMGIPAVVGTTDATRIIQNNQTVTVSAAEGSTGRIYAGALRFSATAPVATPKSEAGVGTRLMLNVASPELAFEFAQLESDGVGLARLEFIINRQIGIHPRAILEPEVLDDSTRVEIENRTSAYGSPEDFYVRRLAEGIAVIAGAFAPRPVIVRLSDFKSNEYRELLGGAAFEPSEENPMIGFRGASRYLHPSFTAAFELECRALVYARKNMGLQNIKIMVPFVRTPSEGADVVALLAKYGLGRHDDGLEVVMMCEIPSNALLADRFLEHFDGFSIGSNDLTQLALGLDRDSDLVAEVFDERDDSVKALIRLAVRACIEAEKYVGVCGQGPSDHADFAQWLVDEGVESISVNPDALHSLRRELRGHK